MSEAQSAGVAIANKIGVTYSEKPECACSCIVIQFVDEGGKLFAVAPVDAAIARELAVALLKAANDVDPVS